MVSDEFRKAREQVIRDNPKHLKCPHCGHEEDIYAATALPEGNGKYTLYFGSEADFCTQCDEPWGRNAESDNPQDKTIEQMVEDALGNPEEVKIEQEDIQAAIRRYPGIPYPLALAKHMVDKMLFGSEIPMLQAGLGWGGVHLERVGELVQRLAEAVYHQSRESITIKLVASDYPETYDHWWIEVVNVKGGDEEVPPIAGWPCCACKKPISPEDTGALVVLLKKKATWSFPLWGLMLGGYAGSATAVLCGKCNTEHKQPEYAIKKEGEAFVLIPISDLEDLDETCQEG